ncbi:hypothetical protein BJV85_002691 [Clostridium acetobutylicum]|nr:hypothetical protein [Clostridium acetobutylicum]NOV90129.1 hypothetical protein [Clostridium acetobutylicum]NOW15343.1 hypothetical protein [Clostridium acetobutylicum]NSA93768.1 hypothetical protein [Clostridium acetobutylicum]
MKEAITRINNIKWNVVGTSESEEESNLGYEFLRRLAKFFKDESIKPVKPLVANIAKLLGDTEEEIDISNYCTSEVVGFFGENIYMRNVVQYYIQLARYADKNIDAIKYLSVYEPAIRIFERGGMFVLKINALDIVKVAHFPLDRWYERFVEKEPINIDGI